MGADCNTCSPGFTGELCYVNIDPGEKQINGYELLVTIVSYRNPTQDCAGCSSCCDSDCDSGVCDTYFFLCVRPFQFEFTSVEERSIMQGNCPPKTVITTESEFNVDGDTFGDEVLGMKNPITFYSISYVRMYVAL